jgi:hypothetical protein
MTYANRHCLKPKFRSELHWNVPVEGSRNRIIGEQKIMRELKPFFNKQKQSWYVQIVKKQHNLGKDEKEA